MMRPTLSEHPGTLHSRDRFQHAVILTYLYHEVAGYYHIGSHTNSTLAPPWWTGGRVLILDEVDALVIDEEPNEPSGDQAQAP